MTATDRERAEVVAAQLGTSWVTVVFMLLQGTLEEAAGRLDAHGQAMLNALRTSLNGPGTNRKELSSEGEAPA
jgi:hypothetical protein